MGRDWVEFAEHIKGLLRKDMNRRADGLLDSNLVKNIEEYRFGAGVIKGMAYAEDLIDEAITAAKQESEK